MGCKITVEMGGRTVSWEVEPNQAAIVAQTLVSIIGPAKEETDGR
jgi:hypothetical protein